MAYAPNLSTSRGLARFRPTQGVYQSAHPTKLSPGFVTSLKAMNRSRAGKPTRISLQCSAELGSQQEPSLLNELAQGLRLSHDMMDSRTKAAALQNKALLAARRQDAACIQQLQAANDELAATAKQNAAVDVRSSLPATLTKAAPTDCWSSEGNRLTQGLCLSPGMLDAKIKATALQNGTLKAARQHDAVRMQQLADADPQLRAIIAQQAATIADQAEAINGQKTAMAQSDRRLSITSKLLSKLWGRRKIDATDLDHLASDSHVELLKSQKQGLQKTLEETEDELAQERQKTERAWAQAQRRATKRQEAQEARDEEEYLKNQMHAKWVQALKDIDALKAVMFSGHFLFEALMKVPLQADVSTGAQEQTSAHAEEDVYL